MKPKSPAARKPAAKAPVRQPSARLARQMGYQNAVRAATKGVQGANVGTRHNRERVVS